MNVRELPRKVEGLPVVKSVFLGWLTGYGPADPPGYHCAVITHAHGSDPGRDFSLHVMRAPGLDKPWVTVESDRDISSGTANAGFAEIEKRAEWPTGSNV